MKSVNLTEAIPEILSCAQSSLSAKRLMIIFALLYKGHYKNWDSMEQSIYRTLRGLVKDGIVKKEDGRYYV